MKFKELREEIISIAIAMEINEINQGTSGNISARIPGGMLITPRSTPYEKLKPKNIIAVDMQGNYMKDNCNESIKKEPSSEWRMHANILANRNEINAVLHCHSIYATAISCHGMSIPSFHYMAAVGGGIDIKCAKYATYGTTELSENALKALKGRYACLLEKHGQLTISSTLQKALDIAIEIEVLAKIYLAACKLGRPKNISKKEMNKVLKKFNETTYK